MTLPFEEIQVCKKETVSYLWIFKAHRLVFYSLGEEIPFQSFLHRDRVYRMVHRYCEGLQDSSIVPEKSSRRRRTFYTSGCKLDEDNRMIFPWLDFFGIGSYPCAYQNGSWLDMGRLFLNDRGLHFMSNLRSTMVWWTVLLRSMCIATNSVFSLSFFYHIRFRFLFPMMIWWE